MGAAPPSEIRVAVIERNGALRKSLDALFGGTPGIRCLAALSSVEEALRILPGANPDVVVVGLCLTGMGGLECIGQLRAKIPRVQLVALSRFQQPDQLFDVIRAGASACVLKPAPPAQLIEAVEISHRGGSWVSPSLARSIFQYFQKLPDGLNADPGNLTRREREILLLAKHGLTNELIANQLGIEYNTVRAHLQNIYEKLDVRSRGDAVATYFRL